MQLPMFTPAITWRATPVDQLPSWAEAKRIAVDIETCDPYLKALGPGVRRGGYIAGVSFAIEDGPEFYLPTRHLMGGNLDERQVFDYLRTQAGNFTGTIVGNNLSYDLDYLWQQGISFEKAQWHRDVQIAEPLLDELQHTYNLDDVAARHGLPGKDEDALSAFADAYGVDSKKELWKLPAGAAAVYAMRDVRLPLELIRRQEKQIDEQELWQVYNLESKVMLSLLRMRRRGIRVDVPKVLEIQRWARLVVADTLAQLKHMSGVQVLSLSNANQLARVFEALEIRYPRTSQGKPSVQKEWLAALDHPVGAVIRRGREFDKLDGTFCKGVLDRLIGDRIHPTYHGLRHSKEDSETVASEGDSKGAGGRTSCTDPNIQNQPIRNKEYGKRWRSIYIAEEDDEIIDGDYSQQEPRTTVHYAEKCGLTRAKEAADAYRNDPNTDSHQMTSNMTGLDRDTAKIFFLMRSYGGGGAKCARALGLPTEWRQRRDFRWEDAGPECQALLDKMDAGVPYIKELSDLCKKKAQRVGYLKTEIGRRCRFPKDMQGNYDQIWAAMNFLIQKRAADQTKTCIINLESAGIPTNITIHDEFAYSGKRDRKSVSAFIDVMMNALPLSVPCKVNLKIGPSLGELTKMTLEELPCGT
jgi:DNA polymerase I-like protein with 3'-5' exonuclease and polymerase domains